ncbi:unnamed protein product, partial [Vitis vinifera]|uniref:Bulb-type lectin domain-containing protein n=1 Tax=Vitis vinifera TaxID=29760 RepID=D7THG5_VITVI
MASIYNHLFVQMFFEKDMGNLSPTSQKFPSILLILLIFLISFFPFATSNTQNILLRGSFLSVEDDSDYITSPDKSFNCGFYRMGENAYWFSIWFTNSKERTVVWMANRNRPVNGRGSRISLQQDVKRKLTMDYDGNLRLYSLNHSTGLWNISWEALSEQSLQENLLGGLPLPSIRLQANRRRDLLPKKYPFRWLQVLELPREYIFKTACRCLNVSTHYSEWL